MAHPLVPAVVVAHLEPDDYLLYLDLLDVLVLDAETFEERPRRTLAVAPLGA